MRSTRLLPRVLVSGLLALGSGCADLGQIPLGQILEAAGVGTSAPLSESTIVAGLREALTVGTERAVDATSQRDGFYGSPRIRIPLPESFERTASGLRSIGLGAQVGS